MVRFGLIAVAILASLYGLHRLCLKLEERGHLYYVNRRPTSSGAARMFGPFQEMVDPPSRQVVQAEDHQTRKVDADEPSTDDGQPTRRWPAG